MEFLPSHFRSLFLTFVAKHIDMLVTNFVETCSQYDNFQIWEIKTMNEFLSGNGVIEHIFKVDYKFPVNEFEARREEIPQTDMEIMKNLLDQVGDKHFHIFTLHDANHIELVHMQDQKIMNFGIDINKIDADKVYIVIMDKSN